MNKKLLVYLTALAVATCCCVAATDDHADIKAEIAKRHDEAVKRLQDWIGQVSIAAEDRGYPEGAEYMAIANDSRYGLAGAVWSADTDRAVRVARRLHTGAVDVNGGAFMP